MAIKIPSKNIYQISHKLPKNYINQVESKNTDLEYKVDYLTLVETQTHDLQSDQSWKENTYNKKYTNQEENFVASANIRYYSFAHIETYYLTLDFSVDKYKNKKLYQILKMYDGLEKEDDSNSAYIKYYVTTKKYEGAYTIQSGDTQDDFNFDYGEPITTTEELKASYTYSPDYPFPNVTASVENSTNVSSQKFELDKNKYKISLTILVGNKTWEYRRSTSASTVVSPVVTSVYREPVSLEISFYGDAGENTKVEIPLIFGEGNNIFSAETNELLSSETYVLPNITETVPSLSVENLSRYGLEGITGEIKSPKGEEWKPTKVQISGISINAFYRVTGTNTIRFNGTLLANYSPPYTATITFSKKQSANEVKAKSIIEAYKNGKETLELLCSISEYSDTDGNLAISTKDRTKPMTFNIGDIALPYKFTAQGDQPLSLSKSNEPKLFLVTGVTPIFDGAVWQKLTLQEI